MSLLSTSSSSLSLALALKEVFVKAATLKTNNGSCSRLFSRSSSCCSSISSSSSGSGSTHVRFHSYLSFHNNKTALGCIPDVMRSPQRSIVTVTKTSSSSSSSSSSEDSSNQWNGTGSVDRNNNNNNTNHNNVLPLVDQDNNVIIITPSAVRQIDYLAKRKNPSNPGDMFLRVFVDAGGCSGFQYKFEMDQEGIDPEEDVVIKCSTQTTLSNEEDNISVRVVIDQASLDLLKGCKVDFVTEMIRSSFAIVDNPQSESACGCGSSFAVKNFESNPALD